MTTKPPCKLCPSCMVSCFRCAPLPCSAQSREFANIARINKQVFMSSSQALQKRKAGNVSKQVGQSACPSHLLQAGGPGDLQMARQQTGANQYGKKCNRNCSYPLHIVRARTAYRSGGGKSGVDRKHGSYARYLARRVGGELRKEKMPAVVARTAIIKQPRSRTGTSSCGSLCFIPPSGSVPKAFVRTRNKTKWTNPITGQEEESACFTPPTPRCEWERNEIKAGRAGARCCWNRIPNCCDRDTAWTGKLGNNTQCVSSTRCSCCPKVVKK